MTAVQRVWRVATSLPARILITVGLMAIVASSIDWGAVGDAISDASWGWFVVAVGLILASFVIASERWRILLGVARLATPLARALRAYLAGAFANNLLPTGFGGDALRAWMVARSSLPFARSLTSVAVDRATALGCGLALGWVGVVIDPGELDASQLVPLAAISTAGLAAGIVALSVLRRGGLGRHLPQRAQPWVAEVAKTLRTYAADPRLVVVVLVLGLAFQLLTVGATWALSEMLGLGLAPALIAVVVPLVLIATALPISIGGFGVREGSYVVLLADAGVSSGDATLLSLLAAAAMALASLPGGLFLLVGQEPPPLASQPD
ncbi:MAG: putative integral rane protein [Solirubrobacterales bacterium]|nr:putative integral rane protein [Solirubrobacterales bacterium]